MRFLNKGVSMFNRTVVMSPYPQRITSETTVTERRAPTDESVRLLREMEAQALKNVISVCELHNNTINATWVVRDDPMSFGVVIEVVLKINGRDIQKSLRVPVSMRNEDDFVLAVHGAITAMVAEQLTVDVLRGSSMRLYQRAKQGAMA